LWLFFRTALACRQFKNNSLILIFFSSSVCSSVFSIILYFLISWYFFLFIFLSASIFFTCFSFSSCFLSLFVELLPLSLLLHYPLLLQCPDPHCFVATVLKRFLSLTSIMHKACNRLNGMNVTKMRITKLKYNISLTLLKNYNNNNYYYYYYYYYFMYEKWCICYG
jgi:hypothetical protein